MGFKDRRFAGFFDLFFLQVGRFKIIYASLKILKYTIIRQLKRFIGLRGVQIGEALRLYVDRKAEISLNHDVFLLIFGHENI